MSADDNIHRQKINKLNLLNAELPPGSTEGAFREMLNGTKKYCLVKVPMALVSKVIPKGISDLTWPKKLPASTAEPLRPKVLLMSIAILYLLQVQAPLGKTLCQDVQCEVVQPGLRYS
jgi:hypothetical protein